MYLVLLHAGEKTARPWFTEEAMTGRTGSILPYLNKKCVSVARPQKGSERWYSKKYDSMSSRLAQRRPISAGALQCAQPPFCGRRTSPKRLSRGGYHAC